MVAQNQPLPSRLEENVVYPPSPPNILILSLWEKRNMKIDVDVDVDVLSPFMFNPASTGIQNCLYTSTLVRYHNEVV